MSPYYVTELTQHKSKVGVIGFVPQHFNIHVLTNFVTVVSGRW